MGIAGNQAGLYEVEDVVTALWRSASGVLGTGSWGYTCFEYRDEVVIEGSTGRIRFAFFLGSAGIRSYEGGYQGTALC